MAMNPRSKHHGVPTANDPITTRIAVLSYTQKRSNDRTDTEASVKGETLIKPIPITQLNPSSSWQLQGYSNTSRIDLSLTRHAPNTYPPDAATL